MTNRARRIYPPPAQRKTRVPSRAEADAIFTAADWDDTIENMREQREIERVAEENEKAAERAAKREAEEQRLRDRQAEIERENDEYDREHKLGKYDPWSAA